MRVPLVIVGLVATVAGAVWLAQGLNLPFAPGSFMTADPAWAAIGVATLLAGLAMVGLGWRRRRG